MGPVPERIFADLNPEQRRAVEAVRGPVCILAGAGSGKTTTITRRIANQVASSAFSAGSILAVTFTDKAATEMRHRLEALGIEGVRASTFHSAALAQLRYFRPDGVGRILASKALTLRHIGNTLPKPYRFRPAGDLATEIEWAKNRRLTPADYPGGLDGHEPPIPADLMLRVFREYERRKADGGWIDFEDLLELTIRLFDEEPNALAEVRNRYRSFTVDEYQDVNLLQHTLLDRWLGAGDELVRRRGRLPVDLRIHRCVARVPVAHARAFPARDGRPIGSELPLHARSSRVANRLVPKLGGAEKTLRADGRAPNRSREGSRITRVRPSSSSRGSARSRKPASPTRRWPSSCARTRGRPTSRRHSRTRTSRFRARHCWRVTARGNS